MDRFSKNTQIPNFIAIHPVGAKMLHADRQTDRWTDMTKLTVTSCNFLNVLKKLSHGYRVIILQSINILP
jgi:hypothetical protein